MCAFASGCGLIDSDVTNFDLTLPDKQFSVDASGWQVNQMAADTFLDMSCAGAPNICSSAATQACPMNCTGRCGRRRASASFELNVSAYKCIDLVTEKPELKQINDEPVIKVTIDSVRYSVTDPNTLNVATPEMGVYVAPITVMDPKDPMAKQIGTIIAVGSGGCHRRGARHGVHARTAAQILIDTMSTYKNRSTSSSAPRRERPDRDQVGQMVPTGKLDAVIQIKAHAGL